MGHHRKKNSQKSDGANFLAPEDLAQFLTLMPNLSPKARGLVNMMSQFHSSGGSFDKRSFGKMISSLGGDPANNNAIMNALSNFTGKDGKLDPSALQDMLGQLGQANKGTKE